MNDAPNESLVQGKNAWIQEMLRSPVSTLIPCSDFGLRLSITSSRLGCKQTEFAYSKKTRVIWSAPQFKCVLMAPTRVRRRIQPMGPQDLKLLSRDSEGNETW